MQSNDIDAKLFTLMEDYISLRFSFTAKQAEHADLSKLHAFFALDKSGSMAGSPMKDAKNALLSFITKLHKLDVPITVIAFDSSVVVKDSTTGGYDTLNTYVSSIKAGGGTLFKNVFDKLTNQITTEALANTFIVFLSDGQDNDGIQKLIPHMESFKAVIQKNNYSTAIHTIGFSGDHDATLMTKLTNFGTKDGTFQYVQNDGRIPVAINNVFGQLNVSSIWGQFVGDKVIKITIEEEEDKPGEYTGMMFSKESDISEGKVELYINGNKEEHKLNMGKGPELELQQKIQLFTTFVCSKVLDILDKKDQFKEPDKMTELNKLVDKMDAKLNLYIEEIKKYKVLQRKTMMPFCLQTKDLIGKFYEVLKKNILMTLDNLKIAELNSLAYNTIMKKSLQKKINKRAGENANMLKEIDENITTTLKSMVMSEIGEKHKDTLEKFGHCLISYKDWFDALQDGDCFCFTFDAERPDSGLLDPELLTIKTINVTILTAESFLDSALFVMKAGQIIQGGSSAKGAKASTLVKGLPDEIITGCLPMYINEDHWKIAKLRLKPLVSWSTTYDVLAYHFKQIVYVPFMVFAKAFLDQTTEFKRQQYQIIHDTCNAIYKDYRADILKELDKYSKYISTPLARTADSIPNNKVFLSWVYFASLNGDLDTKDIGKVFPYVIEEELRRIGPTNTKDTYEFIKEIIPIDADKNVTPQLKEFREKLMESQDKGKEMVHKWNFLKCLKAKGIQLPDMAKQPPIQDVKQPVQAKEEVKEAKEEVKEVKKEEKKEEPKKEVEEHVDYYPITTLSKQSIHFLEIFEKNLTSKEWATHELVALGPLFKLPIYTKLAELGLTTIEQQSTFLIQNILYHVNADRRKSIENNKYVDPFNAEASHIYFVKAYKSAVIHERNAGRGKIMADFSKKESQSLAPRFAATNDLLEAAGVLMGTTQGSSKFQDFYLSLMKPAIPHVIEKCKMLTRGQYMTIPLILDEVKDDKKKEGFVIWTSKSKYAYRIWKENIDAGTIKEWDDAFPHLEGYFERQGKRKKGEKVLYRKPRANCHDPAYKEYFSKRSASMPVSSKKKKAPKVKGAAKVKGARGGGRGKGRGGRHH